MKKKLFSFENQKMTFNEEFNKKNKLVIKSNIYKSF